MVSFEPTSIGRAGRQDTGISFTFNGEELKSKSFDILPVLNIGPPSSYTDHITVDPVPGPTGSALQLYCGLYSTECSPDKLQNSSLVNWDFFMSLESDSSTITEYKIPGDTNVWNSFPRRSLNLSFFTGEVGGGVLVFATIGSMTATPEPPTIITAVIGLIAVCSFVPRRRWLRLCWG